MEQRRTAPAQTGLRARAATGVTLDDSAVKVLRNTYALLAMTVGFSAVTATVSMAINMPFMGLWMLLPYFGCLYAIHKTQESYWGIVWTFALTGFMGLTIGPILNAYLAMQGMEPILLALGGTAVIFTGMSAYTLITKKDFSFMSGFLMIGLLVAFIAGIANAFLNITALGLTVSCMFLVLSSLLVGWQTSAIVHGGERNYIIATVTLFVSLYNIFLTLLHLIGFAND
ncbi:MAG: Bax inhibitor-1/YccA family protein [Gammaproteobacteria bacterium]|nr:Bax inhibitor-1/YccA family protein [Gammaproteobacteria bacterium]